MTLEQCLKQAEPSAIIIFCDSEEHVVSAESDPNNNPDSYAADFLGNIDKVRARHTTEARFPLHTATCNTRPERCRSQMIAMAAAANAKPGERENRARFFRTQPPLHRARAALSTYQPYP